MFRLLMRVALCGAIVLGLNACEKAPQQIALTGSTMGTYYSIKYLARDEGKEATQVQNEIDALLERVNDQMSTYRKTSELSLFNRSETGEDVMMSPQTLAVIQEAIRLNKVTLGALDISVGPLVNLWGFGPQGRPNKVPSEEAIQEAYKSVGIEKISIQEGRLLKAQSDIYLDLSSIAKGYGVDVIADYFDAQHIDNYLVEIGGELRLKGHNAKQQAWRIAVEKPVVGEQKTVQLILQPGDMGIATSGDYRNYFAQDGVRYSHTIDPSTAYPIKHHLVSVTVIDKSCMTADGLATGLNVLGPEKALQVANKHNIPVYMVEKTPDGFKEIVSEAFKQYIK